MIMWWKIFSCIVFENKCILQLCNVFESLCGSQERIWGGREKKRFIHLNKGQPHLWGTTWLMLFAWLSFHEQIKLC